MILLRKILQPVASGAATEEASKTMNPMPTTPGSPGMPPSPEAAASMQGWFPKGIDASLAPGAYERLKSFAEYNRAMDMLQNLKVSK